MDFPSNRIQAVCHSARVGCRYGCGLRPVARHTYCHIRSALSVGSDVGDIFAVASEKFVGSLFVVTHQDVVVTNGGAYPASHQRLISVV